MTRLERETTVIINDAEDTALVETFRPGDATRIRKMGFQPVEEHREDGRVVGWVFQIPKGCVVFRKPVELSCSARANRAAGAEKARRAKAARQIPEACSRTTQVDREIDSGGAA